MITLISFIVSFISCLFGMYAGSWYERRKYHDYSQELESCKILIQTREGMINNLLSEKEQLVSDLEQYKDSVFELQRIAEIRANELEVARDKIARATESLR